MRERPKSAGWNQLVAADPVRFSEDAVAFLRNGFDSPNTRFSRPVFDVMRKAGDLILLTIRLDPACWISTLVCLTLSFLSQSCGWATCLMFFCLDRDKSRLRLFELSMSLSSPSCPTPRLPPFSTTSLPFRRPSPFPSGRAFAPSLRRRSHSASSARSSPRRLPTFDSSFSWRRTATGKGRWKSTGAGSGRPWRSC